MQHTLQTETVSSLKGFFANVPEHFSYLQTSLTEGVGAAERIGTFILLGFFSIALHIGYTQTLILPPAFFSGFSKLVSQQEGSHRFSYLLKNG